MMSEVLVHSDAAESAEPLEPALHALELRQSSQRDVGRYAGVLGGDQGGKPVLQIVRADQRPRRFADALAAPAHAEPRFRLYGLVRGRPDRVARLRAEGFERRPNALGNELLDIAIGAVRRDETVPGTVRSS